MEIKDDIPMLGNIDKTQVPPIDHKRILAFVNNFIINTVTFLNKFAINCEIKFIDFETKLQKIEASMRIVEAKLSSITTTGDEELIKEKEITVQAENVVITSNPKTIDTDIAVNISQTESTNITPHSFNPIDQPNDQPNDSLNVVTGTKTCEDIRYKKYFKMLQFGVPPQAVKMKMDAEGIDPHILDEPNKILDDSTSTPNQNEEI